MKGMGGYWRVWEGMGACPVCQTPAFPVPNGIEAPPKCILP